MKGLGFKLEMEIPCPEPQYQCSFCHRVLPREDVTWGGDDGWICRICIAENRTAPGCKIGIRVRLQRKGLI